MSRWMGFQTIALMAGLASSSFGQMGGMGGGGGRSFHQNFGTAGADSPKKSQVCSVKVVSGDGKTTTGTLRLTSAVIGCPFGIYEIKPEKVQQIRFDQPPAMNQIIMGQTGVQSEGLIVTTTGEEIEGTVLIPSWWRVETDLGLLAPNSQGIKSITFAKKADAVHREIPAQLEPIPAPGDAVPTPVDPANDAAVPAPRHPARAIPVPAPGL